jgi:metallo-beta-lactamase family protein
MRITFHGAAHTATGSQHLLEINGSQLLLECGLYQGRREESYLRNYSFQYDPRKIDAVILSHAQIDHSGNLPNLVKQVFLVHGEPAPTAALMAKLKAQNMHDLYYPDMHTSAEL